MSNTDPNALTVLWKLSNLLVHDSVPLLGLADQLEWIESQLRKVVHTPSLRCRRSLSEIVYDIEDVIDALVQKAAQKRRSGILMRCLLAFIDLIDIHKLRRKVDQIQADISDTGEVAFWPGSWSRTSRKDLDVGDTIISPVIRKVTALLASQEQLSPAVRRQARRLRDELSSLHRFLKDLESKNSRGGMAWMEEVCEVSRSAEDVVGLFMHRRKQLDRSWRGPFKIIVLSAHNFTSQHKLGQDMDHIRAKLQNIWERRFTAIERLNATSSDHDPDARSSSSFTGVSSSSNSKQLHISIFDDDIDDIVEVLLRDDPECITVSIVGMEGTGKTSLAKLIYENHAIVNHFPNRAWVPHAHMHDLMQQIVGSEYSKIEYVNGQWEDYLFRLRQMLNSFLMDKKHLIVIDGVFVTDMWNELGGAFDNLSNGTRIVFIARNAGVTPEGSERNFTYRLQLRSDDESWALFTHTLKKEVPQGLLNLMKKEIVRRCGGLPVMIEKLGNLLSELDATLEEWSKVVKQLNQDEEEHWSGILYEINKNLPLYLRRCLFYFNLFPEDVEIPARRLIGLWVAEGLGRQKIDDAETPENVSEKCLIELVNRNMIQVTKKKPNGKVQKCRLPEALRVHWLSKAREANFLQDNSDIGDNISTSTGPTRRVADRLKNTDLSFNDIHGDNTTVSTLYSRYRDTVSFLSFDTREGNNIGNFLERCISSKCFLCLWVLDLENVYKPRLPKEVGQLTRLRYFGLRSTFLEKLPSFINELLNLQTLDLKRTYTNTLPISIWKMHKLRHLFLDESYRSTFVPPPKGSTLVDLQTLWGVFVDVETPVRNGLDTLSEITKLGLACRISEESQGEAMTSQLDAVAKWVLKLKHLQSLRLKSFYRASEPWDLQLVPLKDHKDLSTIYLMGKLKNQHLLSEFPENLIELTLSGSGLVDDPMQILDKLPNLKILRLFSRSYTGKEMHCSLVGGFPKLEILKLWKLELLEKWIVEKGAMPNLRDLEIRSCKNLETLPDGLQHLRSFREFKLSEMPALSPRIKDKQGEDWNKIAHARHIIVDGLMFQLQT